MHLIRDRDREKRERRETERVRETESEKMADSSLGRKRDAREKSTHIIRSLSHRLGCLRQTLSVTQDLTS